MRRLCASTSSPKWTMGRRRGPGFTGPETFTLLRFYENLLPGQAFTLLRPDGQTFTQPPPYDAEIVRKDYCLASVEKVNKYKDLIRNSLIVGEGKPWTIMPLLANQIEAAKTSLAARLEDKREVAAAQRYDATNRPHGKKRMRGRRFSQKPKAPSGSATGRASAASAINISRRARSVSGRCA